MNNNTSVKVFRITGSFKQRRETSPFSKELCALTEDQAKERLYSEFGSRNRLKRQQLRIVEIIQISTKEITDPFVKKLVTTDFKIPYEE
jgi:large subunit ribosomal protein LX